MSRSMKAAVARATDGVDAIRAIVARGEGLRCAPTRRTGDSPGILLFGGYVGGKLVYQGGLGIDPAILKPGLRSKFEANDSPPGGPTDPVMAMNFDKPAEH
jgi:hypothetical protein